MKIDTLPLDVLQIIDRILKESKTKIVRIKDNDSLLHTRPKDKKFDFFYKISKIRYENNVTVHTILVKPQSSSNPSVLEKDIVLSDLEKTFSNWVSIVTEYYNFEYLEEYDSDIEDFSKKLDSEINFDIVDFDKYSVSYDLIEQFKIYRLLDSIIEEVDNFDDGKNSELIEEIKQDSSNLQKQLPQITKQEVVDKIKNISAKCWKVSLKLLQDILVKIMAEFGLKALKGELF